jgi:four helix bundle suffix protein
MMKWEYCPASVELRASASRHQETTVKNEEKKEKNENDGSHESTSSDLARPIIPPRGDYQTLHSFHKAEVVYDITFRFAHKYLSRRDRTVDQMIQAARSGKKNLLEGSKAAQTSRETELKLTGVARASLEEVLDDYRDYLRVRDHPEWDKNSREALYVRRLGRKVPQTYELYREFVETRPPEIIANIAICLIHQANYLIDRQLRRLEQDFLKEGGLRERMMRARLDYRNRKNGRNANDGTRILAKKAQPHPSPPSHSSHKPPPQNRGPRP